MSNFPIRIRLDCIGDWWPHTYDMKNTQKSTNETIQYEEVATLNFYSTSIHDKRASQAEQNIQPISKEREEEGAGEGEGEEEGEEEEEEDDLRADKCEPCGSCEEGKDRST